MTQELRTRLLGAIESDTLVFVCGAGLSMAAPSSLPSAIAVANECYDTWHAIEALDPALRDNVDALAGHFYAKHEFERIFVNRLVPWDKLAGVPNPGHVAIADLLVCRAAAAALSANFDPLIENWAFEKKIAMRGALDGLEAVNFAATSSPLVKFHGCMQRNREQTIWTAGQLTEAGIAERIHTCTQWMNLNLAGKHLVVVGFWSDWGYLNDVFANALTLRSASSVTVVNPGNEEQLRTKAPVLWDTLNRLSQTFEHVEAYAEGFLNDLRNAFSEVWVKRFVTSGRLPVRQTAAGGVVPALAAAPEPVASPYTGEDLYDLRRDAEGKPYTRAATCKVPPANSVQAAIVRTRLIDGGAARERSWLNRNGTTVRVVNGGGQLLESVRDSFREPPSFPQPDITICAGAEVIAAPPVIIQQGESQNFMRPLGGAGTTWVTTLQAEEIGIL